MLISHSANVFFFFFNFISLSVFSLTTYKWFNNKDETIKLKELKYSV